MANSAARLHRAALWTGVSAMALLSVAATKPALAQSNAVLTRQIEQLQQQLQNMQQQLNDVRRTSQNAPAPGGFQGQPGGPPAQPGQIAPSGAPGLQPANTAGGQASGTTGPGGSFRVGGVTLTIGGFIAAEGVYRSSNETSDIGSTYTGIPLAQSPNAHTGEFRPSARQSRLSLLATGQISPDETASAYYETDFLGAGTTSNSNESNSYVPRLRQAYGTYDNKAINFHVLAGQSWSLLTLNRVGITPRQEDIPLTIDAQYVPGFNWKRQAQLRADADFMDHRLWLGVSLEEPQSTYAATGPNGLTALASTTTVTNTNNGGSLLNSTNAYSNDIAPDLVVKAAFDPGFGHYEAYGVGRLFHDRVSTTGAGRNNTVAAGGVGAGLILPVIPKMLDFQLSGLAGYGIGSYGSGQLPDAVISPSGSPSPIPEYEILAGVIAHPIPTLDIYAYGGREEETKDASNIGGRAFGYGNSGFAEGGCVTELSPAASCVGNTSALTQGTVGAWYRFLQGGFGTLQAGAQYSYTRRDIFTGAGLTAGKTITPSTAENIVLVSLRYLPFQ